MQDTTTQVSAMKAAAKDMKKQFKTNKDLDIDAIDRLNDEMADLMGLGAEIQEALGRNYSVPDDIDEDELLGELDSLEAEMGSELQASAAGAVPSYLLDDAELPAAPVGAPAAAAVPVPAAPERPAAPL